MESLSYAIIWFLVLEIFSFALFPTLSLFFKGLADRGFALSKILGIVMAAYITWILASLHILAFTWFSTIFSTLIVLLGFLGISFINIFLKNHIIRIKKGTPQHPGMTFLRRIPAIHRFVNELEEKIPETVHESIKIFNRIVIVEEISFILGFCLWIYIRGINPILQGTEKFMDLGIMNALLRSPYLPPHDMWLSGLHLNYYYYGQYIYSFFTRLTHVPSSYGYNFAIATIFATSFVLAASIVITLSRRIYAGIISASILTLGGNLYYITQWFGYLFAHKSLEGFNFWYPSATRLIPYTINEYPIYSFVVSDLHAHFTDIPFVLAALLHIINIFNKKVFTFFDAIIAAILLGTIAVTNSWDALIYTAILGIVILVVYFIRPEETQQEEQQTTKEKIQKHISNMSFESIKDFFEFPLIKATIDTICIGVGAILLFLPFYISFHAPVDGIGFDTKDHTNIIFILLLFGIFLFFILSYLVYLIYILRKKQSVHGSDMFVLLLIIFGILLIIVPDIIYLKDIFYKVNPPYFRANTVFKMYYQVWILLSLPVGYVIARIVDVVKLQDSHIRVKVISLIWLSIASAFLISSFAYTYQAINEGYVNITSTPTSPTQACIRTICFNQFKTDNGEAYIHDQYPADAAIIVWLNTHAPDASVIAEAVGDSYTYFARISANTGLATVLGWPNHEYQWRNTYAYSDERTKDLFSLYNATTLEQAQIIVNKYHISYIIVSDQERIKYSLLNESIIRQLGKVVLESNGGYIVQTT